MSRERVPTLIERVVVAIGGAGLIAVLLGDAGAIGAEWANGILLGTASFCLTAGVISAYAAGRLGPLVDGAVRARGSILAIAVVIFAVASLLGPSIWNGARNAISEWGIGLAILLAWGGLLIVLLIVVPHKPVVIAADSQRTRIRHAPRIWPAMLAAVVPVVAVPLLPIAPDQLHNGTASSIAIALGASVALALQVVPLHETRGLRVAVRVATPAVALGRVAFASIVLHFPVFELIRVASPGTTVDLLALGVTPTLLLAGATQHLIAGPLRAKADPSAPVVRHSPSADLRKKAPVPGDPVPHPQRRITAALQNTRDEQPKDATSVRSIIDLPKRRGMTQHQVHNQSSSHAAQRTQGSCSFDDPRRAGNRVALTPAARS